MAIEHLPRPWLLAALTGLPVSELVAPEPALAPDQRPDRALPRPEPRRRRLCEVVSLAEAGRTRAAQASRLN